ncbi:hypothetical protein GY03_11665 [Proteus vulgaris]|uniref:hypothetical protein n=1 Tax=Proteus vulgaris TaxID=585 RepID=UPI0021B11EC0|nr:hypothetical protein [Proteus vulgaris]MCT6517931.1 hypothetical protein [Proteus vulgaris]
MNIHEIGIKFDNGLQGVNSELNKKRGNLERVKSISNTSLPMINKTKDHATSILPMSEFIKKCQNILDQSRNSILVHQYNGVVTESNNASNQETSEHRISNKDPLDNSVLLDKETNNSVSSIEGQGGKADIVNNVQIKKLPDWIFNTGINGLNTEQKLILKKEKTRSFKNLLKPFISPIKFMNRSLLPIKINFENIVVNKPLGEFKFDDELNNNDAFMNFSDRLKKLNKTFVDNIKKVKNKKILSHKKIDVVIKYETLERALECKLVNDIKILSDEFKADLAKNKFQKKYYDLLDKIKSNLDSIFKSNSISNSNIDEVFSSKVADNLSDFLKEEIDSQNGKIDVRNVVNDAINSVISQKDKIITEFKNDPEGVKKIFYLNLTKEIFKNLSKETAFIDEKDAVTKVDDLIKTVKDNIAEKMGKPTDKIITLLKNSFYQNIKPNDNGDNLLIRLFKNSSNNIHYKWAQDAVLLLINYETFETKTDQASFAFYQNDGVVSQGGGGSVKKQKTTIEDTLSDIYSRLGLSNENLDESKDEVLRKYFANYF